VNGPFRRVGGGEYESSRAISEFAPSPVAFPVRSLPVSLEDSAIIDSDSDSDSDSEELIEPV